MRAFASPSYALACALASQRHFKVQSMPAVLVFAGDAELRLPARASWTGS